MTYSNQQTVDGRTTNSPFDAPIKKDNPMRESGPGPAFAASSLNGCGSNATAL